MVILPTVSPILVITSTKYKYCITIAVQPFGESRFVFNSTVCRPTSPLQAQWIRFSFSFSVVFEGSPDRLGNHFLLRLTLIVLWRRRWSRSLWWLLLLLWLRTCCQRIGKASASSHSRHTAHSSTLLHRPLELCPNGRVLHLLRYFLEHGWVVRHGFHVLAHHWGEVWVVPHHLLHHWVLLANTHTHSAMKEEKNG